MPLNIGNAVTERLATELALLTGAIHDRLERLRRERSRRSLADELDDIGRRCAKLPVLDGRAPDEILQYDEHGVPRR